MRQDTDYKRQRLARLLQELVARHIGRRSPFESPVPGLGRERKKVRPLQKQERHGILQSGDFKTGTWRTKSE
jgi:hypothetical protein